MDFEIIFKDAVRFADWVFKNQHFKILLKVL